MSELEEPSQPCAPPTIGPGCRVLVVDDNEINRDLLKLRLEVRGYSVETVDGGAEAVALLGPDSTSEPVDAVLLDIMMPDVSGLDVLRQVRRRRGLDELPIIMTTARDESESVVEALMLGANDYVTKPIDFPVLFARLESQLRLKHLAEQKDEFLAIASHDLKNPLSVVRGFAKMLNVLQPEGSPMTAESRDLVERIVRQTVTMERIVNDFLDFQAFEDGRLVLSPHPVNLHGIATEVVNALSEYAREKQVGVEVVDPARPDGGPELPETTGDELRLSQVVENLIGNALKFAAPGSRVTVQIRAGVPPPPDRTLVQLGAHVAPNTPGVLFEVIDTGPGIPEREKHRLFIKYARLSNRPTGGEKSSGVGLAICKLLIELHGGRIGAQNNAPPPGSTFWFWLPAADHDGALCPLPQAPA